MKMFMDDIVTGLMIGNFSIRRENDPIKVIGTYPSDVEFSIGINNSICDITVQLGQGYRGKTKGLLGE